MTAQAEPASPLAPGASPFVPSPSLSPSLPAPLPPPSPLAGMPPPMSAEPAMGGAQAMFASLPGFAASMADRSPTHNPGLAPPPPPSPPTPAGYAAAAAVPLGSPSPAPSFNLADANSLLDAMKVGHLWQVQQHVSASIASAVTWCVLPVHIATHPFKPRPLLSFPQSRLDVAGGLEVIRNMKLAGLAPDEVGHKHSRLQSCCGFPQFSAILRGMRSALHRQLHPSLRPCSPIKLPGIRPAPPAGQLHPPD